MKRWTLGLALLAALLIAVPASAITVQDVIGLARAGASDTIILSKIDADGTVFRLTVDEILELKQAGVSDTVITYMINTGKSRTQEEAPASDYETSVGDRYQSDEDYETERDSGYNTSLDDRYRGTVSVSYTYYYPHWPGYWWSYYYDPFWWPSLSFYFTYWPPYPYYYWYYDPWYRWGRDWYAYWDYPGYWDRYGSGHYRHRTYKGRNVGSRGQAGRSWRTHKGGGRDRADEFRGVRNRRIIRRPKPGIAPVKPGRSLKKPAPGGRRLQPPREPVRRLRPEKPAPPSRHREVKPAPRPGKTREIRPAPRHPSRPSPSPGHWNRGHTPTRSAPAHRGSRGRTSPNRRHKS